MVYKNTINLSSFFKYKIIKSQLSIWHKLNWRLRKDLTSHSFAYLIQRRVTDRERARPKRRKESKWEHTFFVFSCMPVIVLCVAHSYGILIMGMLYAMRVRIRLDNWRCVCVCGCETHILVSQSSVLSIFLFAIRKYDSRGRLITKQNTCVHWRLLVRHQQHHHHHPNIWSVWQTQRAYNEIYIEASLLSALICLLLLLLPYNYCCKCWQWHFDCAVVVILYAFGCVCVCVSELEHWIRCQSTSTVVT